MNHVLRLVALFLVSSPLVHGAAAIPETPASAGAGAEVSTNRKLTIYNASPYPFAVCQMVGQFNRESCIIGGHSTSDDGSNTVTKVDPIHRSIATVAPGHTVCIELVLQPGKHGYMIQFSTLYIENLHPQHTHTYLYLPLDEVGIDEDDNSDFSFHPFDFSCCSLLIQINTLNDGLQELNYAMHENRELIRETSLYDKDGKPLNFHGPAVVSYAPAPAAPAGGESDRAPGVRRIGDYGHTLGAHNPANARYISTQMAKAQAAHMVGY